MKRSEFRKMTAGLLAFACVCSAAVMPVAAQAEDFVETTATETLPVVEDVLTTEAPATTVAEVEPTEALTSTTGTQGNVGVIATLRENLTYLLDVDHATVGGIHISEPVTDIVILEEVKELPVTAIEEKAFADYTSAKTARIPASVTEIGEDAFSGCTSLETVTILNKDCKIAESPDTIPQGIIYGYLNSTAQAYAQANGLQFIELDAAVDTTDPTNPAETTSPGEDELTDEERAIALVLERQSEWLELLHEQNDSQDATYSELNFNNTDMEAYIWFQDMDMDGVPELVTRCANYLNVITPPVSYVNVYAIDLEEATIALYTENENNYTTFPFTAEIYSETDYPDDGDFACSLYQDKETEEFFYLLNGFSGELVYSSLEKLHLDEDEKTERLMTVFTDEEDDLGLLVGSDPTNTDNYKTYAQGMKYYNDYFKNLQYYETDVKKISLSDYEAMTEDQRREALTKSYDTWFYDMSTQVKTMMPGALHYMTVNALAEQNTDGNTGSESGNTGNTSGSSSGSSSSGSKNNSSSNNSVLSNGGKSNASNPEGIQTSPDTGVKGIGGVLGLLGVSGAALFAARRRKK